MTRAPKSLSPKIIDGFISRLGINFLRGNSLKYILLSTITPDREIEYLRSARDQLNVEIKNLARKTGKNSS